MKELKMKMKMRKIYNFPHFVIFLSVGNFFFDARE